MDGDIDCRGQYHIGRIIQLGLFDSFRYIIMIALLSRKGIVGLH
jgi:hypothetical protein